MSTNDIFIPLVVATEEQLKNAKCTDCHFVAEQKVQYLDGGFGLTAKESCCTGFGKNPIVEKGNIINGPVHINIAGINKGERTQREYPASVELQNGSGCKRFTPKSEGPKS